VPRHPILVKSLTGKIYDFTVVILLPLFFGVSGLRTDLRLLNSLKEWGLVLMVCVLALLTKTSGVMLASRAMGYPWIESLGFGIFMSTKGLVALIAANIARDEGIVTPTFFSISIALVIIVTFLIVPLTSLVPLGRSPDTQPHGVAEAKAGGPTTAVMFVAHKPDLGLLPFAALFTQDKAHLLCARLQPLHDGHNDLLHAFETADKVGKACIAQGPLHGVNATVVPLTMATTRDNLALIANVAAPGALLLAAWDDNLSRTSARLLADLLRNPVPLLFAALQNAPAVVQTLVVLYRFNQHELRDTLACLKRKDVALWLLPLEDEADAAPVDVAAWTAATTHLATAGFYIRPWPLDNPAAHSAAGPGNGGSDDMHGGGGGGGKQSAPTPKLGLHHQQHGSGHKGAAEPLPRISLEDRVMSVCNNAQLYDAVLVQADKRSLENAVLPPGVQLLRENCFKSVLVFFDQAAPVPEGELLPAEHVGGSFLHLHSASQLSGHLPGLAPFGNKSVSEV
jgi:hypothetical protein